MNMEVTEQAELNMEEIKQDELFKKLDDAAGSMSYYNAAEGDSWYTEKTQREQAQKDFYAAVNAFIAKYGVDATREVLGSGRYLISLSFLG